MEVLLLELWIAVREDCGRLCGVERTAYEEEILASRTKSEGSSFLTITLPKLGKGLQKALDEGRVSQGDFRGFKTTKEGFLPLFLEGFWERVFDRATGLLLDQADNDAIFAIRQLSLLFAKLLLPCSDARVEKAFDAYVECEKEVRAFDSQLSSAMEDEFRKASLVLWGTVLQAVDEDIHYQRIIPRHGPGATADRLTGNGKYEQVEWTERLEHVFPLGWHAVVSPRYDRDVYSGVNFLEPGAERPVRVISVPKTLETTRIIAIEPTCMQFVQQGLLRSLTSHIESPFIGLKSNVNNGFSVVGFTDQTPNQRLAQEGSLNGTLATLDLSEASDRVSNQLVRVMTQNFPNLQEGLDACRSRVADVPGHGLIRLAKFASMGSATTFPIEALVFSTLVFMGIARQLNEPVTPGLIEAFRGRVRVYGDDIVVPSDFAPSVVQTLETFGSKVNVHKSFWTGRFRESCGKEYYAGSDVSIVKMRQPIPSGRDQVSELLGTLSTRNQFYWSGCWTAARLLDSWMESLLRHYPVVESTSSVLGRESVLSYQGERLHPFLHSPLVKGWRAVIRHRDSFLDGHGALLKCLLKQGDLPFADSKHLLRGGRPENVRIKLGYGSPF